MKTIHPLELEARIETSKPVEIIDLRPRHEFEKLHVAGAHSLPVQELTPETLIRLRELPLTEPVYLISGTGVLAREAAENLERRGLDSTVVVEGGMKACERDGLPTVRYETIADWLAQHRTHLAATGIAEWR
jgi:rhodanese-related sulfurtransferase